MPRTDSAAAKPGGWHQQDILAAVRKTGASIASLNRDNGFKPGVLRTAFYKRWPKGQRIIAQHIGVPVETLWPQWYGPGGSLKPLQGVVRQSAA